MSITDELRELAWRKSFTYGEELTAIADRIDAEHEKAMSKTRQSLADAEEECDYLYTNYQEYKQKVENELSHYVELPMDEDGEYIHAGDKLDGYGKTITVVEMRIGRSGWILISRDGNAYADTFAFTHHATTIEDVLREFAEKITDSQIPGVHPTYEEAIAEYAKRLTLRAEVDE